jgi:hypothetical protein
MSSVTEITLLENGKKVNEGFLKSLVGQKVLVDHELLEKPMKSFIVNDGGQHGFFQVLGKYEHNGKEGLYFTLWGEDSGILTRYRQGFIKSENRRFEEHNKLLKKVEAGL